MCTTKQAAMERTYDYFLREVDPIIGDCITYLLCVRPDNVAAAMMKFLEDRKEGKSTSIGKESTGKATKAQRLYLATQISPVITKLVNRIATDRPKNVLQFMCTELSKIIQQDEDIGSLSSHPSSKQPGPGDTTNNPAPSPHTTAPTPTPMPQSPLEAKSKPTPKTINIIFLGIGGAGKSSLINALQGKLDDRARPTIGFRPTSMMMGDDKIRFYDVGGGPKIRKIWPEYFHDVHGIVYMADSSLEDSEDIKESAIMFKETMENPLLANKPTVFLSNKQDAEGSKPAEFMKERYDLEAHPDCKYAEVSCLAGSEQSNHPGDIDPRIESTLESLLNEIQLHYETLSARVDKDCAVKAEMEAKKRQEKERRILRNKIISAFPDKVDKAFVDENTPKEPEDVFSKEEGESFLVAEIGIDKLPEIGVEVAAMVGYQKLALQIIGAFICPVSKKKKPMTWEECKALVSELRVEIGLTNDSF